MPSSMTASSPFASDCSHGESLQETTLDFRDVAGEEVRLLFPFFFSLLAGKKSERVTLTWLASSQLYTRISPRRADKIQHNQFPTQQGPCDVHSKQKPDSKRVLVGLPGWQMQRKLKPGGSDPDLSQNGYGLNTSFSSPSPESSSPPLPSWSPATWRHCSPHPDSSSTTLILLPHEERERSSDTCSKVIVVGAPAQKAFQQVQGLMQVPYFITVPVFCTA